MATPSKRPNFLIIVADDLGYSDISPFGGEIHTPNLNSLANDNGIRLTNFHTASACSPTRSMLFSGTDHHIAGLGQMAEHMKPRELYNDRPGYEGYLNFRVAALSEILQDGGYHTIISGKWHLGLTKETSPSARGFTKVHSFLPGSGNHYNFEPQPAPPLGKGTFWMKDDQFIDRATDLPDDFYSTKTFTDNMLSFLSERTADPSLKEKPFFAYLPFTAPHWPLQAQKEVVDKYKGVYDDGPEALRERRLQKMKDLGLISPDVEPAPFVGWGPADIPWSSQTPEERAVLARKMEVYAAMVDQIDVHIGRVVDYLRQTDELDNTFILFISDNGAEGTMLEAVPMMGMPKKANDPSGDGEDDTVQQLKTIADVINKYYDNSFENIGRKDSFTWYGPRWACASMAPSKGFKTWITEGGIRCPCLIRYPSLLNGKAKDKNGKVNTITDAFTTVMDILPTVLELAGIEGPKGTFRGREVVPVRGKSWVGHLKGDKQEVHDKTETITGWELFGLRAIRQGSWKAVYMPPPRGNDCWELYNVETDPGEIYDKADEEKEIMSKLIEHWDRYYAETGMFYPDQKFLVAAA